MTDRDALNKVIDAWESLKGGSYSPHEVEEWLRKEMKPAMDKARKTVGRAIPSS